MREGEVTAGSPRQRHIVFVCAARGWRGAAAARPVARHPLVLRRGAVAGPVSCLAAFEAALRLLRRAALLLCLRTPALRRQAGSKIQGEDLNCSCPQKGDQRSN